MDKRALQGKLGRRQFAGRAAATAGISLLATPGLAIGAGKGADSESVGPISLPEGAAFTPGVYVDQRARKPIYLPGANAGYAAHAVSEVLFWTDQLMEHGMFIALLMPGDRLRGPRSEARQFQMTFAGHFLSARDRGYRDDGLSSLLLSTRADVLQFIEYKRRMQRAQEAGTLKSLVWPLFFDHIAREAERFADRLALLAQGSAALQSDEVAAFWTTIMADHLEFVAHLLDPQERALVADAKARAEQLYQTHAHRVGSGQLATMADEVIDFKTAAEHGIEAGQIKSIIDPSLADHVLREAVRFSDEVRRAG
ncbi:hypothetical protein BE04_10960 [Sorangium cellulosum]|uniref:Uncharacterized protein n=1 Tax=Sorangium cellulosum TaxID=56 RepID=A0A150P9D9_SORCE|nr:DUF2935 domain-containing protein [Sorangium cellulosum]KYF52098.1 hypothetical protein BE04_10960 [Sorangium cellulosum]